MDDKISEVQEAWQTGKEQLSELRSQMRHDLEMAYGDQWWFTSRKPNQPYLSINFIRGRIRRRSGFIRQNMPEARVVTLSNEGAEFSDVMQQALKYIYSEKENYVNRTAAIDNALTCGLGWLHIYMSFDDDVVNGDVKILNVSPFDIVFDPYVSSPDFKDCRYIIHRSFLSKEELKRAYPKFKADIDLINDESEEMYEDEVARNYKSMVGMANIFDYWYIKYEKEKWYVNLTNGDYGKYSDDLLPMEGDIKLIEKEVPRVYLRRVAGNDIILFDDESPYLPDKFPYIPVVCYNNPTHPNWQYRIQGITRGLKDLQLEKNKRRSSIMANVLNKFLRGYMKLRDETADLESYIRTEAQILEVDSLDSIREMNPPMIPEALMVLEKEIDNDLNVVDTNLEMLDNASTYQAVGALQLKLRESLLVDQEIYDNVNFAMYKASSFIVELINRIWTTEKFKRIVGYNMPYIEEQKELEEQATMINSALSQAMNSEEQEQVLQQGNAIMQQVQMLQQRIEKFWYDFEKNRKNIKFIIRYGEGVEETPTYKLAYLNTFTSLKQQGQNVPDEIYIEFLDIPKRLKDKWIQTLQAQQQAQQQILLQQQEHEQRLEEIRAQVKIVLQDMINEGKIKVEELKSKDVYEYDITRREVGAKNADTKND